MENPQAQVSPDVPAKLTDWANEPTLASLKLDLEQAKPAHDTHVQRVEGWINLLKVSGSEKPPKRKNRSSVQPKLVRRQAEWRYSALSEPFLSSPKLFNVKPATFEDAKAARQNELVLNWQFRTKLNKVKLIDDFVRSTTDTGTAIVRVGWRRVTKKVKEQVPTFVHYEITDQQNLAVLQQAIELKAANPREYQEKASPAVKAAVDLYEQTGTATTAEQSGVEEVMVDKVLENRPTLEILNHSNFYLDPSCNGDVSKAMFAVVSFETNLAELKADGKYTNLDKVIWEGSNPLAEPDHATNTPDNFNFADRARKKVVAYEYWGFYDIEGNDELQPFVATWIGNTLIRMELNPFPDGKLPFVVVPYLPLVHEAFGEPDAELLGDNQRILGALMRGMVDLMGKSANAQQGMAKGLLDPLNYRRFIAGEDYEFNPNQHPNNGFVQHTYPEIPQSALTMLTLQNQEAEGLTGVKSFSGGVSGSAYGDVAAGIRGALDAASKREMAILRRLAKGMTEVGEKIIAMNSEFLTEEEVVRVTNEEFETVLREDLAGNFDLEVDIATAEVDNAKAQDLGFMLQTLGPNMDPSITMEILAQIAELKRMPELAHKLRNYKPQPDPIQEQIKQAELQKALMEVEKLRSEVELNKAKTQEAMANADKKNLDFVEQETGTAHAREMEQQKAQSRGNQNLEITKALTKPTKEGESRPDIEAALGFSKLSDSIGVGNTAPVISPLERDIAAAADPALNLNSSQFDPSADPSLNQSLNF